MILVNAVLFIMVMTIISCSTVRALSDDTDSYYSSINGLIPLTLKDEDLKTTLQTLTFDHSVLTYDDVWNALDAIGFEDGPPCTAQNATYIADVYSSHCWKPELNTEGGECGSYKKEGDCFNREHLWPKSWFGGFDKGRGAQTDLWELYPSDGYVNGLRGNLPLGPVTCAEESSYVSSNGSKIGPCDPEATTGDYQGKCFEPADNLKGDFARSYFYLSVTYMNKWGCCDTDAVNKSDIKPWAEAVLRAWHKMDPVNDYEREKNDIIFNKYQHNRNPFVDHPEWVDSITDF